MAEVGQLEALPPPWPNAGYQFTNPTFAGPHSSYRIAPIPAIRVTTIRRFESTRTGISAHCAYIRARPKLGGGPQETILLGGSVWLPKQEKTRRISCA